jgi:2-polyprenyl-3-methyl-5-hydroxy-6-metoxy-1,4-benzoquinol methylase
MADVSYWTQRLRRYGHTGWSDFATYWYDQRLRLRAIERAVLAVRSGAARSALDFGCGVGDFCTLLAGRFESVVGYDVSADILQRARQRNGRANIRYTDSVDQALGVKRDLILSITVLQHITDDAELATVLQRFASTLAPGGHVAIMETLADSERHAGYLKRRTVPQLLGLFAQAGLVPQRTHDFYHPTEAPTPAYARYRARVPVQLLTRLAGWRVPGAEAWLRHIAQRAADADTDYLDGAPSPTKILVFARKEPAR